jgi:hypothetical protein
MATDLDTAQRIEELIVTWKMSCAKWTSKGRLMFAPRNAVMCRSIGASAWASLQTQAAPPSQ